MFIIFVSSLLRHLFVDFTHLSIALFTLLDVIYIFWVKSSFTCLLLARENKMVSL